ncbi:MULTISPECIES: hypothetical protein [Citrobacter]|uniref:hypothetical protein n=1 Tax=Citrobacter TaxID=544 RepID=UPI000F8F22E8|nr:MULTISPECIES: hypothetical protein [Citrobacter]EHU7373812.1 hypothetical protein [Citrobacter freundii]MDG9956232.1 hypothetical protein [Citrobacter portucalensis]MDM2811523.1 hypothetical protein [Citrobacter sp. Cpo103]MDN4360910.1 hypothetical protein [Citrobacter portucalensis]MDN4365518.1 hypothetical protein [Citrobacter portucalensis]
MSKEIKPVNKKELKEIKNIIDRAYWQFRASSPELANLPIEIGKDKVTNYLIKIAIMEGEINE